MAATNAITTAMQPPVPLCPPWLVRPLRLKTRHKLPDNLSLHQNMGHSYISDRSHSFALGLDTSCHLNLRTQARPAIYTFLAYRRQALS